MKTLPENDVCIDSLKLVGDFWTLRIVDALRGTELRYCELQRAVGNVNPVTLTAKLKKLEDTGLLNRTEESIDKISVTYRLTTLGKEVLPVIDAVNSFSSRFKK